MLQMYCIPGDEKSQEIGKKFVNDRLISLFKDAIIEYVDMYDEEDRYRERITCQADWEKPIEEIIDLERLSQDEKFFEDYLDFNRFVPATVGPQQALHDFFSLYRLLKAKGEYKPDLTMEYMLYVLIHRELDFCEDMPENHKRIKRIPEPERSMMMADLTREAEFNREGHEDLYEDETLEETVEALFAYYEDLDEYIMTCFEDTDFLFLDEMDEDEMELSGMAEAFGMNAGGERNTVIIEGEGQRFEFDIPPWELEM